MVRAIDYKALWEVLDDKNLQEVYLPVGKGLDQPQILVNVTTGPTPDSELIQQTIARVRAAVQEEMGRYASRGALSQIAAAHVTISELSADLPKKCRLWVRISDRSGWNIEITKQLVDVEADPREPAGCHVPSWVQDLADK